MMHVVYLLGIARCNYTLGYYAIPYCVPRAYAHTVCADLMPILCAVRRPYAHTVCPALDMMSIRAMMPIHACVWMWFIFWWRIGYSPSIRLAMMIRMQLRDSPCQGGLELWRMTWDWSMMCHDDFVC